MQKFISLADKVEIPATTKAILWDMDGVLIDSLGHAVPLCNQLLSTYFGGDVSVPREFVRLVFAFHIPEFWKKILHEVKERFKIDDVMMHYDAIVNEYQRARHVNRYQVCPGIDDILYATKKYDIRQAVVSNNPTNEIKLILENAGLVGVFDCVVGNDMYIHGNQLKKKPAPDSYLFAAQQLGVPADQCVVVEDSVIGVQAGKAAGCFVVGVATGGATFKELLSLGNKVDKVYTSFN